VKLDLEAIEQTAEHLSRDGLGHLRATFRRAGVLAGRPPEGAAPPNRFPV
jgi:hypothetical protein